MEKLINAPCVFCGYDGTGYWQKYTHDKSCPFYRVGGESGRKEALLSAIRKQSMLLEGLRDSAEILLIGDDVI